jgi:hypothetical protein
VQQAINELYTILKFTTGLFIDGGSSTSIYENSMILDGDTSIEPVNKIMLNGGES